MTLIQLICLVTSLLIKVNSSNKLRAVAAGCMLAVNAGRLLRLVGKNGHASLKGLKLI